MSNKWSMIQPRSYQAGSKQGAYTFCFVQS